MLSADVVLIHDNTRLHTANSTKNVLQKFCWEVFDQLPYSPHFVPRVLHLKKFLSYNHLPTDENMHTTATSCLDSRWQISITLGYENLSRAITSVAIPVILMLRNS